MRIVLVSLLLVLPTATLAAPPVAAPLPANFQTVAAEGWSYGVPSDWIELTPPPAGTKTAWRSIDASPGFYTNVNLVLEAYVGDQVAYQAYSWTSLAAIGKPLTQRAARIGNRPGFDIETSWPTGAAIPYRTLQRGTAAAGQGYIMTCSGSEAAFERIRPLCTLILESLRLP